MITKNGVTYVLRNSSEDNGKYSHYYYTDKIVKTYNIIYEGQRGTLTTTTVVYLDEDTDQIIDKDYFSWSMRYGNTRRSGTCLSQSDEDAIQAIIDKNGTDDDGDTSHNDSGSGNNNNNDNNGSNSSDTDDNNNSSDKGDDSNNKGLFDDTQGEIDANNPRSSLPIGADINNDGILDDIFSLMGENPKENNVLNKGTTYPIIRINDHYFQDTEITYFSMETGMYKNYYDYQLYQMPITGFIPTMKLIVTTSNRGILKQNLIKQGDRCSVFFSANHKMVKSMRCDFRITSAVSNQMDQNRTEAYLRQIITGELYIPDLRNEEIRYNFNGSSRDAMMDAAKRLRLSFFFCDPDDTDDIMVWCNCKSPELFIQDLTTHAWKNSDAFFESWIDPRYGLSFQNINRLLGEEGFDEPLDVTFWINTLVNSRAADGKAIEESPDEKVANDKPQAKIITNIIDDPESATTYHINKWRITNSAQEIQDFIGLNCKMQFDSVNPGIMDSSLSSKYSVEFSLCLNRTKFDPNRVDADNDFYVLLGPARNMTYASADETMGTSETESSNKADPEQITNQQSDGDSDSILATDGNMLSSGNTHKFYDVAYEHNMRNLLQLQKQYLTVELNGANLTIVRGEKLPVMLMDLNKAHAYLRSSQSKTQLTDILFEAESGWYIVDGIEWVFDPNNGSETGTSWRTNVKLVRREWPIPGKSHDLYSETSQDTQVVVDIGNGQTTTLAYQDALAQYGSDKILGATLPEVVITASSGKINTGTTNETTTTVINTDGTTETVVTGTLYTENGAETVSSTDFNLDLTDQYVLESDKVKNSTIPLTGLKTYMKEIYNAIVEASGNKVKLVSARRWAVDEYGNKVDGNAYVTKNGYYKCMNAIGEVMYFKKNNSRHLYGEAIDIINNNGISFSELMTNIIMKDGNTLRLMYNNGVSAYIEQAQDDTSVTTKHYHIGTDTTKQKEFWSSVKAILGSDKIPGTLITFSNYMKNNNTASTEITKINVDENSLVKS